jgi:hypothetical protein
VISDAIRFVTPDPPFADEYPLQSGIEARDRLLAGGLLGLTLRSLIRGGDGDELRWEPEAAYLQIFVRGFIGKYGTMAPVEEAIDYLKALLGIAIALRLFRVEKRLLGVPSKATFYVHRKIRDKWIRGCPFFR